MIDLTCRILSAILLAMLLHCPYSIADECCVRGELVSRFQDGHGNVYMIMRVEKIGNSVQLYHMKPGRPYQKFMLCREKN